MRVMWEVEDGYVGQSRPQYTVIPREDLDACETEQEREELIDSYVQEDFEQRISWAITDKGGE